MQYDISAKRTLVTGLVYAGRTRVKGVMTSGTASAGVLTLWDTSSYAALLTTATYGRAITTGLITITHTAHGFATGDTKGFLFTAGTGGTGTAGNYPITVVDANTYTVVDPNGVAAVTAGAAMVTAARWLVTIDTPATTLTMAQLSFPGEGILAYNGIYVQMTNLTGATIFYG